MALTAWEFVSFQAFERVRLGLLSVVTPISCQGCCPRAHPRSVGARAMGRRVVATVFQVARAGHVCV